MWTKETLTKRLPQKSVYLESKRVFILQTDFFFFDKLHDNTSAIGAYCIMVLYKCWLFLTRKCFKKIVFELSSCMCHFTSMTITDEGTTGSHLRHKYCMYSTHVVGLRILCLSHITLS